VASVKRDAVQLLESNAFEVSVAVHQDPPSWHIREALFEQRLVCLYDPSQLGLSAPLTMEDYAMAQHVIVSSDGNDATELEDALSAAGIRRDIVSGVSRHAAIAALLQSVPAIATVPEITAYSLAPLYRLAVSAPPLALPMEPISMLYRRSDQMDGRSIWFRDLIKDVILGARDNFGDA
jgi:DNA-binding transcriptional LysR family regulator